MVEQQRASGTAVTVDPTGEILTFRSKGATDPRLRELVRLLARQAADDYFDGAAGKPGDNAPG